MSSPINLERRIAAIARTIFLPEFSFASNKFKVEKVGQFELADHVVWVDDLLIAIQMKEREAGLPEANWFDEKVLKKGTRQVRDTLKFLGEYKSILIENQRGHRFNLEPAKLKRKFMVVVYDEPVSVIYRARPNHYVSKTAGLIHVLRSTDLLDVCRTLITLSEIASYLEFRATIVRANILLSERAILGQFLRGARDELPDERNAEDLSRFRRNRPRFDIRWFFKELPEVIHTYHNGDNRAYYSILKEYVLLDRFELEQARIRIGMVNDSLKKSSNLPPVIMATQRGTCFVWIATPEDYDPQRFYLLQNMIYLAKYKTKMDRCVGIAHTLRRDGNIELDMGYLEAPWTHDPLAEEHLADYNPFLPFGIEPQSGYRID
jgi:hypothetical protein